MDKETYADIPQVSSRGTLCGSLQNSSRSCLFFRAGALRLGFAKTFTYACALDPHLHAHTRGNSGLCDVELPAVLILYLQYTQRGYTAYLVPGTVIPTEVCNSTWYVCFGMFPSLLFPRLGFRCRRLVCFLRALGREDTISRLKSIFSISTRTSPRCLRTG